MDELRESSLLFSLEGLLETERERVQREAREAQKRRQDELERVAEVAERRRLAAEQERESCARREALERERDQLEQERRTALKHAIVERARLEAEGQLRLVEAEQARKHDLALTRIREAQHASRYRTLCWLSSGALCATVASAAVGYFGWIAPAHSRESQVLRSVAAEQARLTQSTQRALAAEQRASQSLSEKLRALETKAAEPRPAAHEPKAAPTRPVVPGTHEPPKRRGDCGDSGDPLDNCLH